MKYFISTHRIREDAITTWMGATTKAEHEGIEFLGLSPELEKVPVKRQERYLNGVKNKGITGEELALQQLPATMDELKQAFISKGFAAGSAGPSVGKLIGGGKVEKGIDGVYRKVA